MIFSFLKRISRKESFWLIIFHILQRIFRNVNSLFLKIYTQVENIKQNTRQTAGILDFCFDFMKPT